MAIICNCPAVPATQKWKLLNSCGSEMRTDGGRWYGGVRVETLPILKTARVKPATKSGLFDSLISFAHHLEEEGEDEGTTDVGQSFAAVAAPPTERSYELRVGGRKCHHSESTLLVLNRPEGEGLTSQLLAILNFTNSILGAGLVGLPYAMMQSGLLLGIGLLVAITLIVDWSILLLIKCGRLACATSYQDLMGKAFGRPGLFLCATFQVVFALGGMCAYTIIMADNLSTVGAHYLPGTIFASRPLVILLCTLLILLPLSLVRQIGSLGSFSLLALLSVVFIIMAILFEAPGAIISDEPVRLVSGHFVNALGIFSFAFVCHHNSFEIHDSLEIPSISSFTTVTHASTAISLLASMALTIPAYLCFSTDTQANVLNNFGPNSFAINMARLSLAVSLMLTYPLDCLVARQVITEALLGPSTSSSYHLPILHPLITSLLVGITLTVGIGYTNLEMILELTGGVAASGLAFIFPAACYLKLAPGHDQVSRRGRLARLLLCFGILVLLTSTISTLYRASFWSLSHHGVERAPTTTLLQHRRPDLLLSFLLLLTDNLMQLYDHAGCCRVIATVEGGCCHQWSSRMHAHAQQGSLVDALV